MTRIHAEEDSQSVQFEGRSTEYRHGGDKGTHTLKTEVREESYVLGTLFTLGEFCEDQESSPSLTSAQPNGLPSSRQAVEEAFGDIVPTHDANGPEAFKGEVHK